MNPFGELVSLLEIPMFPTVPPFATEEDERTSSFIPLFYYQGEHFYLDGTEFGYRVDLTSNFSAALFTRLRMADFPEDRQNEFQEDGYAPGVQLRYQLSPTQKIELEAMNDGDGNGYANLTYAQNFSWDDLELIPYATATYKSADFNTKYYGLDQQSLDGGIDLSAGVDAWYHVISNFYLYGKAQFKLLNSGATESRFLSADSQNEFWLGFAFRNDKSQMRQTNLKSKPYVRLAYGFATTANLGEIIVGDTIPDKFHNHMTSLFYGHPVSDTLFSLPMPVYLTPGVVWHQSSEVQDDSFEFILAFKTYYTLPIPWRIRLGVAEGLSYVTDITYIEAIDMDPGTKSSKLLYHLGFSVDLNLGDIFSDSLKDLWLGYDIHHRSAVFESASQFGRFKGGSNYNTVYLQYHF